MEAVTLTVTTTEAEIKMRLNKLIFSFFIIMFSWMAFHASVASAQGDPVAMLKDAADHMIAGLKANKATLKTKPQIVYGLAYKYVVPHADLPEMSKRVLPPAIWNKATPAQRQQFQKQFTVTLIRTYASALSSYQDQSVQFYPIRGGATGNVIEVNSDITSPENSSIRVSYQLIRTGGGWRLIDLSVEGVDMLDSFRSQFSDILSAGSMDELLKRMSSHNSR